MKEHPELISSPALRNGLTLVLVTGVLLLWVAAGVAYQRFNELQNESVNPEASRTQPIEQHLNPNVPPRAESQ